MIRREAGRMLLSGPVKLGNVAQLLEEGRMHLAEGVATVDLSEVTELDSSALALLLAWLREAKAAGRALAFTNLPEALRTIARLYGVEDLLPAAFNQCQAKVKQLHSEAMQNMTAGMDFPGLTDADHGRLGIFLPKKFIDFVHALAHQVSGGFELDAILADNEGVPLTLSRGTFHDDGSQTELGNHLSAEAASIGLFDATRQRAFPTK